MAPLLGGGSCQSAELCRRAEVMIPLLSGCSWRNMDPASDGLKQIAGINPMMLRLLDHGKSYEPAVPGAAGGGGGPNARGKPAAVALLETREPLCPMKVPSAS